MVTEHQSLALQAIRLLKLILSHSYHMSNPIVANRNKILRIICKFTTRNELLFPKRILRGEKYASRNSLGRRPEGVSGSDLLRLMSDPVPRQQIVDMSSGMVGYLTMATSPDTVLRLVYGMKRPSISPLRAVGIDDKAIRKGQTYGTLVVDLDRRRPIDLLPN